MDVAIDAAVALGIVENNIRAYVPAGVKIITTGENTIVAEEDNNVNLNIYANQVGKSKTKASGYSVGESTAVGAAVAINITESNIGAEF